MAYLNIINPGLMTTVQDQGRFGLLKFGIPVAGAMDLYSLQLANLLVGNPRGDAGLEATFTGPTIAFESKAAIAITGADMSPAINDKPVELYRTIHVRSGDVLSFGALKSGLRTYIAIEGGIQVPEIMGSRSTYLKAGIGGFQGRRLKAGDQIGLCLPHEGMALGIRKIPDVLIPRYKNEIDVRIILGPEDGRFTAESRSVFLNHAYEVTNHSDRMGLRLNGPMLVHEDNPDILSSGIKVGTIQVAGDGQPIVLMADRQTTGGYTRFGSVISVDLRKMAQAKPGDKVSFHQIDLEKAQMHMREDEKKIAALLASFDQVSTEEFKDIREYRITVNGKPYEVSVIEIT